MQQHRLTSVCPLCFVHDDDNDEIKMTISFREMAKGPYASRDSKTRRTTLHDVNKFKSNQSFPSFPN